MKSNYYSVTEAAKILEISRTAVKNKCKLGKLEGAQKVGNIWIIPKGSIKK